tara:strand:+ start:938 stop:1045 length:108 start_codon:yes stop_codon:yes gene_type:complete
MLNYDTVRPRHDEERELAIELAKTKMNGAEWIDYL